MVLFSALPPELYEIINCAIATTAWLAWTICLRYLATEVVAQRRAARALSVHFGFSEIVHGILQLRLAFGLTVFLSGEGPRMTWVWLARFLINNRQDADWMGATPWVFVPIIGSTLSVVGLSCVIRSILPIVWGRWGYFGSLGLALSAVLFTQLPAVRSFGTVPAGSAEYAFGVFAAAVLTAILWKPAYRLARCMGGLPGKQG